MDWKDRLARLLGHVPPRTGELSRRATHRPGRPAAPGPDPAGTDGIIVTPEYGKVMELLDAGCPVTLVTGGAGTGKSTLIRYVRATTEKRTVVAAPTGVAALNAGGQTIHSFCRLPPHWIGPHDVGKLADRKLIRKLELLVVDEVSMVRCDVMDAIDTFLRLNRESDSPFGGVQLLLVGDLFQLPPVVTAAERPLIRDHGYDSEWFFSARALAGEILAPVELTRPFRHASPADVALLNRLRLAEDLETILPKLNARCGSSAEDADRIILTCTNHVADRINAARQKALPGPERVYLGKVRGEFNTRDENLPSPFDLRLKVGSRVMFTKNDGERRWVNGTMGEVRELFDSSVAVAVAPDGVVHDVQPVAWISYRYRYNDETDRIEAVERGRYTQIPLMPAWAVTIHKSQGRTLDRVLVDLGAGAFAPGQVYVALSRCRSLEDVVLRRPIRRAEVRCHPVVRRFHEALYGRDGGG